MTAGRARRSSAELGRARPAVQSLCIFLDFPMSARPARDQKNITFLQKFSYTAQLSIFNLFVIRTRRMETFGKMRCRFQELEQNSPKKQKSNHRTQNGSPNSGLECAGGAKSRHFWRKVAPNLDFRDKGHPVQTRSALALADRKPCNEGFTPRTPIFSLIYLAFFESENPKFSFSLIYFH